MSATQRSRGKAVVRNGRQHSFSIDALTYSRLVYATHLVKRMFDVPASMATIVRAAVRFYVDHLETVAAQQRCPTGDQEEAEQTRGRERYRVMSANHGSHTPWRKFPEHELQVEPMPLFSELLQRHYDKLRAEPLPPPESFGQRWMNHDNKEDF